jgi:hypothetical protein
VEAQIRNQTLGREEDWIRGQAHLDPVGLFLLMKGRIDFNGGHGFPEKMLPCGILSTQEGVPSILYFSEALSTINPSNPIFHDHIPTIVRSRKKTHPRRSKLACEGLPGRGR